MDNIIRVIARKVNREVEENINKALEGNGNLDDIIDSLKETVDEIGIDILLAIITELNSIIKKTP